MVTPKVIGRYEIVEELGRGAMGSVFKARDPIVGRLVALKTIHTTALQGAQSEEYRARFQREARASGVLAHPGIVPVFDVGEHEGAPFLVMEFVEGRTLDSAMKKGERFTLDRVCDMGQQIADALGYAHRQGVIHRDIKPANILLTAREVYGSERPRITDFGIAKLAASEITTTGQLLGTPAFMPPEQFTGAPIDGRADLFSLGVILYSLATGEQPFPGETMTAVSYKVVYTDPIPPAKLNPAVSQSMQNVILKCLSKSPSDRYQTGEEMAQDLGALRAGMTGGMQSGTILAATPKADPEATIATNPNSVSQPLAQRPAATNQPAAIAPAAKKPGPVPGKKSGNLAALVAAAAVVVLAAAGGGWYYVHHRPHPPAPQPHPTPAPTLLPVTPVQPPPAPQPITGEIKPSEGKPAPKPNPVKPPIKPSAGKPTPPPTPAPAPPPAQPVVASNPTPQPNTNTPPNHVSPPPPAAPAFDPHKLDPNTNAKLKVELNKFPNGLQFTIEMNKKPYLTFVSGDSTNLENLFVPPGVQQFTITMKSGGQTWQVSQSEEFKAKKKKNMKIELVKAGQVQNKITLPIDKTTTLLLAFSSPIF